VSIARLEGIEVNEGEAAELVVSVGAILAAAERASDREKLDVPLRKGMRDPGRPTKADEDPYNAFIRKCRIEGADSGLLAGLTVGIKDNIAIGGVPMTEGGHLLSFTPTTDAVVIERLLDAGATIVGTLNLDERGGGATGVMSAFGPARNPIDPTRTAGGSSGGSGAAVRSGAVDLALGVDQGGSGRLPAAFCGVVGVKATHGLVPSFGVGHIDHTLDHVTPLARDVRTTALCLEAIAGEDWRDPQWVRGAVEPPRYSHAANEGVAGMRIAVIEESFREVDCDPAVISGVERAVSALRDGGAVVENVSLPIWAVGFDTFMPLVAHFVANMIRTEGVGIGHLGYIDVERMHAFAVARRTESGLFSPYIKSWIVADRLLRDRYLNLSFGTLQNQRLLIRRRISEMFGRWDLLLTPTAPMVAPRLHDHEPSIGELLSHSPESVCFNTAPLNLSGNPALSIPTEWGRDRALPTAVQIIAPHFRDFEAFRAAFELERALGPFHI
jgi:amidase